MRWHAFVININELRNEPPQDKTLVHFLHILLFAVGFCITNAFNLTIPHLLLPQFQTLYSEYSHIHTYSLIRTFISNEGGGRSGIQMNERYNRTYTHTY